MLRLTPRERAAILATTEAAALAAGEHVGRGDKNALDGAAVAAMRAAFETAPIDAQVVIGEGEKDAAPMLYAGERLGTGTGPALDIAVDPVDGTGLAARGESGAISVLACAPAGSLVDLGSLYYMEKLVCAGPAAVDAGVSAGGVAPARATPALDLDRPVAENLALLSRSLGRPVADLTVAVQDRPRNRTYADAVVAAGARLRLFTDGDVVVALRAAGAPIGAETVDLLIGIGGAPESVLTAAAVRTLGGVMQCRPAPQSDAERRRVADAGLDATRILPLEELAAEPGALFLTAVTDVAAPDGPLLAARTVPGADLPRARAAATDSLVIEPGPAGAQIGRYLGGGR